MRTILATLAAFALFAADEAPAPKLDRIILTNGRALAGTIESEADDHYMIKLAAGGGGALLIKKDRVESVVRGVEEMPKQALPPATLNKTPNDIQNDNQALFHQADERAGKMATVAELQKANDKVEAEKSRESDEQKQSAYREWVLKTTGVNYKSFADAYRLIKIRAITELPPPMCGSYFSAGPHRFDRNVETGLFEAVQNPITGLADVSRNADFSFSTGLFTDNQDIPRGSIPHATPIVQMQEITLGELRAYSFPAKYDTNSRRILISADNGFVVEVLETGGVISIGGFPPVYKVVK